MHVVFAIAHAQWSPHRGGGKTPIWEENALSRVASALAAAKLRGAGVDVDLVEMPERWDGRVFRCSGACGGAECGQYKRGNDWLTTETRRLAGDDSLAISLHMDKSSPGRRGPLALINHGRLVRPWADAYLAAWESSAGTGDRGVWPMPDNKHLFPSNPLWVRSGPPAGAVLLEMGCASSALDAALFDQGRGVELVAATVTEATLSLLN